jgi:hypothetical protein
MNDDNCLAVEDDRSVLAVLPTEADLVVNPTLYGRRGALRVKGALTVRVHVVWL